MYAHQSISSVHRLGSKRFDRPSYRHTKTHTEHFALSGLLVAGKNVE